MSLTAEEMVPMIQWPLRRVTANVNNSCEYLETSLNPSERDILHTMKGED